MRVDKKYFRFLKTMLIIIFIILVTKFLTVTIYYNEEFSSLALYQTDVILDNPMPRGGIFDRNDELIVGNKEKKDLVYLNNGDMDDENEWVIAQNLASNIDVSEIKNATKKVDYQDLIIRENYTEISDRLTLEQQQETDEKVKNQYLRDATKKSDYDALVNKYSEDALAVKIKMDASSTVNPQTISEDLSKEEIYYLNSNFGKLGGAFIRNSWERTYPYGNTMRGLLGSVGDIEEDELEKYEAMGYKQDDKVGTSYIEEELEPILKSSNQQLEIYYDENGNIINYKEKEPGHSGNDVKLTIDIKLQKKVDKILRDSLKNDSYPYFKNTYSTIVDPNTGQILAMSGISEQDGKYYDNSPGNFTNAYEVGSIVKPAVLLMGYDNDVWEWNKSIIDEPMYLGGGLYKGSYHDYGKIDETKAIKLSSNVYFYTIILQLAGIDYQAGDPLPALVDQKYFDLVRSEFESFGLGAPTGIDFEYENTGVKSSDRKVGLYMDLANGQYDTYTPLQTVQYASTLANGKYRMKMNYVYSINNPGGIGKIGTTKYKIDPEILNSLPMEKKDIDHVRKTLKGPSQPGGTTYAAYDSRYAIGSKSGTSESFYYEEGMKDVVKTNNTSFLAYAPYNDPQIAMTVIMPYWTSDGDVNKASATNVGAQILDACYDLGYIN